MHGIITRQIRSRGLSSPSQKCFRRLLSFPPFFPFRTRSRAVVKTSTGVVETLHELFGPHPGFRPGLLALLWPSLADRSQPMPRAKSYQARSNPPRPLPSSQKHPTLRTLQPLSSLAFPRLLGSPRSPTLPLMATLEDSQFVSSSPRRP